MKAQTWEDIDGKWGWSIFDEYGDEIASSDKSWSTRAEARQEMYGGLVMKYYSTWQEAFVDFIERFGHNYKDSYNLAAEFEEKLGKNIKGVYYMYIDG